ncbi:MAG TPA: hypothetical protein VGL53_12040 [Bryobacteraceae bacterium]|jgi:hypothetical protein
MFDGQRDKNYKRLDKDPNGSWVVAPLIHPKYPDRLVGFISTDNHVWSTAAVKDQPAVGETFVFQLHALNVVADIARFVVLAPSTGQDANAAAIGK